jgi:hypothetical protein
MLGLSRHVRRNHGLNWQSFVAGQPAVMSAEEFSMSARERSNTLRERLAYEAARIMVEQGLSDFDRARRKAAERTGILDRRCWPSNEAVQEAVLAQRRLFRGTDHALEHRTLKDEALQAMEMLHAFSPRLIGSALTGAGDRRMGVELLLFADRPEDVLFALVGRQIPWQESERGFRYPNGQRISYPSFRFVAGETPFELTVLPPSTLRNLPLDPVSERPLRGADASEVRSLLGKIDSAYRREIGT